MTVTATSNLYYSDEVRQWLAGEGYPVAPKGRISKDFVEKFRQAHASIGFTDQPAENKPAPRRTHDEPTSELNVILTAISEATDESIMEWLHRLDRPQLDEFQRLVNFRLSSLVSAEVRERNSELRRQRGME